MSEFAIEYVHMLEREKCNLQSPCTYDTYLYEHHKSLVQKGTSLMWELKHYKQEVKIYFKSTWDLVYKI
jgi:hypothetical protein